MGIEATVKTPYNDKTAPKIERNPDFMRVPEDYLAAMIQLPVVRPRFARRSGNTRSHSPARMHGRRIPHTLISHPPYNLPSRKKHFPIY